ncbi:MAG TPA: hypothetical protein VMU02_01450 [bacterium]|nr:hypothetical protein [bacterium]
MKSTLVMIALVACLTGELPHGRACGSLVARKERQAGCDTVLVARYVKATTDSGYDLVEVDASGDSLSLYLQWIVGANPHLRLWGPTVGRSRVGERRLFRLHRFEILDPQEIFESATDITTQGANSGISDLNLGEAQRSADGISWRQTWRYTKHTGLQDTLGVVRTVRMRCGDPYYVVRYDLTWLGSRAGSVRFFWSNHPRLGLEGSRHDVGFAPGVGLVLRQQVLSASRLGYFAAMIDLGNPLAVGVDTLSGGHSSYLSPGLKVNSGSGKPEFLAGFVCFNPRQSIVPEEFAWIDSTGEGVSSLDYDSPHMVLDTTRVLASGFRILLARTAAIEFTRGETKTLEYAVGRARLEEDRLPPVFPEVTWLDGTRSRCPKSPRRSQ